MRPQPVTAAAHHVPADRPLLISRCCANRGGDLVVPNASPVPRPPTPVTREWGPLVRTALYGLPRGSGLMSYILQPPRASRHRVAQ
jgi:hypothetical protein